MDNSGNIEGMKWNDVFVDCFIPSSSLIISADKRDVYINASAYDEGVGVEKVELYYRYSPDNETWSDWEYLGNSTLGAC